MQATLNSVECVKCAGEPGNGLLGDPFVMVVQTIRKYMQELSHNVSHSANVRTTVYTLY